MSMSHVCESQNIGDGAGNRYGRRTDSLKQKDMAMGLSGSGGLSDIHQPSLRQPMNTNSV